MSKLLAFLGGAAEGITSEIEKAEKSAKEEAMLRIKKLSENFEKTKEENKKLQNSLREEEDWIKTYYPNATPEQIAFLQGSPAALQGLKKMADPTKIDLSTAINIAASGDKANSSIIQDVEAAPAVMDKVASAVKTAATSPAYRSGLGGMFDRIGEDAGNTAANRYARMMGTDVQTMEALKPLSRPSVEGTFDASLLRDQPGSVEEIAKAAKVQRFQAGQKFGKDSDQYKQADAAVKEVESELVKADTKLEDRRDRLELQRRDSQDPAVVAVLTKEINGLNADIKARREATSTKSEREGKGDDKIKYSNAKTRMEDYMNTDMTLNKGLGWRKYVEEKVVKDPATGNTIVIPGKKVNLTPEQEKEYIEGMTAARMQGLKDLGLVTENGQPINNEVKSLMTAYGLNRPSATPAPATPAAVPTAQSASNKMPAPKTQAEYDAIPPNTEYMDTDGKIKRKGGK